MNWAWPWPSSRDGEAVGLKNMGQGFDDVGVGGQARGAAIQRQSGFVGGDFRHQPSDIRMGDVGRVAENEVEFCIEGGGPVARRGRRRGGRG